MKRPKLVAITGTIGSGKSLVGNLLSKRSFSVIDTDQLVHELFATDSTLQRAIADRFGSAVLTTSGDIDRNKLGEIVFNDQDARQDLEAIVHPSVLRRCEQIVRERQGEPVLFFLVPLLFEAHIEGRYDEIWTVITDESVLKQRLTARTGLSESELDKRLQAQMAQSEKAARSHRVINNSGTIADTASQVDALVKSLL